MARAEAMVTITVSEQTARAMIYAVGARCSQGSTGWDEVYDELKRAVATPAQAGRGTLPEGPHPLGYGMEEKMRVAATIRLAHWAEWGDSMPGGDETLSSLSAGDVDGYLRMADAVIASIGSGVSPRARRRSGWDDGC